MHVINVHYACDTPVTRSAGPCDCPDLPGRSPAALQAPTDQFNTSKRSKVDMADQYDRIMNTDEYISGGRTKVVIVRLTQSYYESL